MTDTDHTQEERLPGEAGPIEYIPTRLSLSVCVWG